MNKKGQTEFLESPAFWILAGVGNAMAILGWIGSKKMGMEALPIWQLLILILVITGASAFFAMRE